ncbi:hypothetical protein SPRG_12800 [Saprolegnia parasitica CBS 223.65]|uniref:Cytochrome P450 n=1 Tax=Saprolegnia parasitica (strain CBS 223.65) TaxID=695850 RepID=A0A067BUZ4_SAPPC|nr:hypothetical protein SPRG_12800 [Saprolegnia parasitica CBS 223.65]KDO22339.1 hypothetical protein SPRG_12800 [Saprolegnia parasitica CBS 223.65]|eukprot:XP_012206973.1 hypothetical protein SPRG_12800 [Saprolegnia parasitica CBS 223.65]
MLRARLKSTLAAVAAEIPAPLSAIPTAPEVGFGPFRCSLAFFGKDDGLGRHHERFDTLHKMLGPIYKFRVLPFSPYMVSICDQLSVAHVYRKEGPFPERFSLACWRLHRREKQWPIGIVNAHNHEEWKKFRASMSEHILQPHNITTWLPRLNDVAKDLATRLAADAASSEPVNVALPLKAFGLESVSSLVFGKRMGCLSPDPTTPVPPDAQAFIDAFYGVLHTSQDMLNFPQETPDWVYKLLPVYKEFVQHADYIFDVGSAFVLEKMAARDNSIAEQDLLSVFLARPEFDQRDAVAQAVDLLFASVDTTGTALLWITYCLATAPNGRAIQIKMRDEANAALAGKSDIDDAALEQLSYIRAVVKETLRLYPVANPNQRVLPNDLTLLGYSIPKGTSVLMQTYTMSRDPTVFENPNEFKPERWLERDGKTASQRQAAAYSTLPFGMGARGCAGRRLAETEMYMLLAHLVRKMELQWPEGQEHPDAIIKTFMMPNKEFKLRLVPWSSS